MGLEVRGVEAALGVEEVVGVSAVAVVGDARACCIKSSQGAQESY
jgi:hypothetical protein